MTDGIVMYAAKWTGGVFGVCEERDWKRERDWERRTTAGSFRKLKRVLNIRSTQRTRRKTNH
jgi:hypothetical protein